MGIPVVASVKQWSDRVFLHLLQFSLLSTGGSGVTRLLEKQILDMRVSQPARIMVGTTLIIFVSMPDATLIIFVSMSSATTLIFVIVTGVLIFVIITGILIFVIITYPSSVAIHETTSKQVRLQHSGIMPYQIHQLAVPTWTSYLCLVCTFHVGPRACHPPIHAGFVDQWSDHGRLRGTKSKRIIRAYMDVDRRKNSA